MSVVGGTSMFVNMKGKMDNPVVHKIMAYAMFDSSPEGVSKKVHEYVHNPKLHFYAWVENDDILGICGCNVHDQKVEILLIAVDENSRGRG